MEKATVLLNRSVIPDYEDIKWRDELKKYGLSVNFLFDGGVQLIYDSDRYDARVIGQDSVEFYDTKTKTLAISYIENFGNIEFYIKSEKDPILRIPILDL